MSSKDFGPVVVSATKEGCHLASRSMSTGRSSCGLLGAGHFLFREMDEFEVVYSRVSTKMIDSIAKIKTKHDLSMAESETCDVSHVETCDNTEAQNSDTLECSDASSPVFAILPYCLSTPQRNHRRSCVSLFNPFILRQIIIPVK